MVPDPASLPGYILSPGYVLVRDGTIAAAEGPPPRAADVRLDAGVLVPGFVDLQVNGYDGAEFDAVRAGEWRMVAARLPETGTTAFVPTLITAPVPRLAAALRQAAGVTADLATDRAAGRPAGARVLGSSGGPVHLPAAGRRAQYGLDDRSGAGGHR